MLGIKSWDHVGIRVHDFDRSMAFYGALGFRLEIDHGDGRAYEIVNEHGIRLNLIVNASYDSAGRNVLLDEDIRHPGHTHLAWIVDDLDAIAKVVSDSTGCGSAFIGSLTAAFAGSAFTT